MSRFSIYGALTIVLASTVAAEPMTPEARFDKAISLLQSGRYTDAIPMLEELSRSVPRAANVYWNLGLADEAVGAHEKALAAWTAFHQLEPGDWKGREKLIQALEANGREADAEKESDALVAQWHREHDSDLRRQKYFCREILQSTSGTVAVLETFDTTAQPATYFTFVVQSGSRSGVRLSLANDVSVDAKMRGAGRLADNERMFVLDLATPTLRETYQLYKHLPTYAALRKDALAALAGKVKPLSSLSVSTHSGT